MNPILLIYPFIYGNLIIAISPPINWSELMGKWECEKVIWIVGKDTTDVSAQYLPHTTEFKADFKFQDDYLAGNTSVEGIYNIDKSTNTIYFTAAVQSTRYPDAKVPVPDLVFNTGKQELVVKTLTSKNLTLIQKHQPYSEGPGDYLFYFKK